MVDSDDYIRYAPSFFGINNNTDNITMFTTKSSNTCAQSNSTFKTLLLRSIFNKEKMYHISFSKSPTVTLVLVNVG